MMAGDCEETDSDFDLDVPPRPAPVSRRLLLVPLVGTLILHGLLFLATHVASLGPVVPLTKRPVKPLSVEWVELVDRPKRQPEPEKPSETQQMAQVTQTASAQQEANQEKRIAPPEKSAAPGTERPSEASPQRPSSQGGPSGNIVGLKRQTPTDASATKVEPARVEPAKVVEPKGEPPEESAREIPPPDAEGMTMPRPAEVRDLRPQEEERPLPPERRSPPPPDVIPSEVVRAEVPPTKEVPPSMASPAANSANSAQPPRTDAPQPSEEEERATYIPPHTRRDTGKSLREETVDINTQQFLYADYLNTVKRRIKAAWFYPLEARLNGMDGTLLVSFSLDAKGRLIHLSLQHPSGKKLLDKTAIQAIQDAAPYAPFPRDWPLDRLNIRLNFEYILMAN